MLTPPTPKHLGSDPGIQLQHVELLLSPCPPPSVDRRPQEINDRHPGHLHWGLEAAGNNLNRGWLLAAGQRKARTATPRAPPPGGMEAAALNAMADN